MAPPPKNIQNQSLSLVLATSTPHVDPGNSLLSRPSTSALLLLTYFLSTEARGSPSNVSQVLPLCSNPSDGQSRDGALQGPTPSVLLLHLWSHLLLSPSLSTSAILVPLFCTQVRPTLASGCILGRLVPSPLDPCNAHALTSLKS